MFSDYEVYVRVVEAGSLSAAARDLGLSPAMISKRLARLEERLGVRLLQRTTRRAAVTDAGQVFYEKSANILQAVEEAERAVWAWAARRAGS
jgi:DNA-binding transcriptional LysR family regulator